MLTQREKCITPKPVSVFHIKLCMQTFFGIRIITQLFPSDIPFCGTGELHSNNTIYSYAFNIFNAI